MFGMRKRHQMVTWVKPGGSCAVISDKVLTAEHSLIAGTTGCGKSTFLHSVMQAFLMQYTPAEGKLVLIDPKVVELRRYKDLPHTLAYETDEEDILNALLWTVSIMEDRYDEMGARRIEDWDGAQIFVVIDELADLLCSPHKVEVKVAIQRLTQKGRAAGIHVIACTQAPSRKILSAEILLNIPARFGLACASAIESKQIVGIAGCEELPNHGGCIYRYKRELRAVKLPFVRREDIQPLIDYWMGDRCKTVRAY